MRNFEDVNIQDIRQLDSSNYAESFCKYMEIDSAIFQEKIQEGLDKGFTDFKLVAMVYYIMCEKIGDRFTEYYFRNSFAGSIEDD